MIKINAFVSGLVIGGWLLSYGINSNAASPELDKRAARIVTKYNKKLVEWSHHPLVVQAVVQSNTQGPLLKDMTNEVWEKLFDDDPPILLMLRQPASNFLRQWDNPEIVKIVVRDLKGNLVASAWRPRKFNVFTKPFFQGALTTGKVWSDDAVRPDSIANTPSIQIAAPIKYQGRVIGVIHSAVIVR